VSFEGFRRGEMLAYCTNCQDRDKKRSGKDILNRTGMRKFVPYPQYRCDDCGHYLFWKRPTFEKEDYDGIRERDRQDCFGV